MTRDEIIHIGVESGLLEPGYPVGERVAGELERFAALIAAAEHKACLEIADLCADADMHASMAANAIRARGQA